MDEHFQIKSPLSQLELRSLGVTDATYSTNIWDPTHDSALLQGEWLLPTATYDVLTRHGVPTTKMVVGTHGGLAFPILDLRGDYVVQSQPGPYGSISVVYSGTFECYTDRISTAATATNMTIGTPVGLQTNTLNIAGGGGAGSSRLYLMDSVTWGTDLVVGWVIRPYDATTGYVGVLMQIGSC